MNCRVGTFAGSRHLKPVGVIRWGEASFWSFLPLGGGWSLSLCSKSASVCVLPVSRVSPSFGGVSSSLVSPSLPSFGGVSSNLFPASSYSLLPGQGSSQAEPRAPLQPACAAHLCLTPPAHRLDRRPPHSVLLAQPCHYPRQANLKPSRRQPLLQLSRAVLSGVAFLAPDVHALDIPGHGVSQLGHEVGRTSRPSSPAHRNVQTQGAFDAFRYTQREGVIRRSRYNRHAFAGAVRLRPSGRSGIGALRGPSRNVRRTPLTSPMRSRPGSYSSGRPCAAIIAGYGSFCRRHRQAGSPACRAAAKADRRMNARCASRPRRACPESVGVASRAGLRASAALPCPRRPTTPARAPRPSSFRGLRDPERRDGRTPRRRSSSFTAL